MKARRLIALALAAALTSAASGQAEFFEGFDGPPNGALGDLVSEGWDFRVQSAAGVFEPFSYGNPFSNYWSQAGANFLHVTGRPYSTADVAWWILLPEVPDQIAGDPVRFWVGDRVTGAQYELRYSPTGRTSTGTTARDVGDFTEVLLSFDPPVWDYTQYAAEVPGGGRLAIRIFDNVHAAGSGMDASIDTLTVGEAGPPCTVCPIPLPDPGQTVHWTQAIGPVVIDQPLTLPAGGTVIVDPGVEVRIESLQNVFTVEGRIDFMPGSSLEVIDTQNKILATGPQAEVNFLGSPSQPVTITGGDYLWYTVDAQQGAAVRLDHAHVNGLIHAGTFYGQPDAPTLHATNSVFEGGGLLKGLWGEFGTVVAEGCTFNDGAELRMEESFMHVDDLTFNGAAIDTYRRKAAQPIYLNNITATGVLDEAPFQLNGFDYFFDAGNTISGNRWPVHLTGGGIVPGSVLPKTGNTENVINVDGTSTGLTTLPDIGLTYVSHEGGDPGGRTVLPGVTVKMAPGLDWHIQGQPSMRMKGRKDAPIVFEPLVPGQNWETIFWEHAGSRNVLDWCEFRGANRAIHAYSSDVWALNCLFEDNVRAMYATQFGAVIPRKTVFLRNQTGIEDSPNGGFNADGTANPNWFEGNTVAAKSPDEPSAIDNWWGHPSGPQHPNNPAGQGDFIEGFVAYMPFRTVPPDMNDAAPSVRVATHSGLMVVGQVVILQWEAEDDGQIVGHRIEHTPHSGCDPLTTLVDGIPAGARSWVVTIPDFVPSSCVDPAAFRIVAIDDAGHEGFDDFTYTVPNPDMPAGAYVPDPIGMTLRPGQEVDACMTPQGAAVIHGGPFYASLLIDSDVQSFSLGGTTTNCLPLGLQAPPVSTDLARVLGVWSYGAGNRSEYSFSPYFEIRPDPELTGDLPPTVEMLTPTGGQRFVFGSTVPITWTAGDDEAVRSFDVHASYDGGRTWNVLARDLPSGATGYDWRLPPSDESIADVRVRVIVRDLRFQITSHGADRRLSFEPGDECYPDCDGAGALDIFDFLCFQDAFVAGDPYADCDANSVFDVFDFLCFQDAFVAGCP